MSLEKLIKNTKLDPITGCRTWIASRTSAGYGNLKLHGKSWYAHRLMYTLLVGPIPKGLEVRHGCNNPSCVNIDHLSIGTSADNSMDMVLSDRSTRGERHTNSKLKNEDIREIRRLRSLGWLQKDIAARFGVCRPMISMILSGHNWAHIA